MATDESDGRTGDRPEPLFVTAHWSVVLAAGHGDTTRAADALAHLCKAYWYPLYAYARGRGSSPHDAQDLTQEFFARLLAGNWIAKADQQRGRFRSFLLSAMKHFIANEWNKAQTQKRGGGQPILSLNDDSAEHRYRLEPVEKATPESLFERGWALTLLDGVLAIAFKTAKNTRGLLQITDWTDNPRGVKIRYKLVRDSKTDVAPTSSVAPAAEQP
jgi:DNA-directed RNA polymerase specialized sigma24 family protein